MSKFLNVQNGSVENPPSATMDKNLLKLNSKVASSPVFSSEANWEIASFIYKKAGSSVRLPVAFRNFSAIKQMKLKPGMANNDNFELAKVILSDFNRNLLILKPSDIQDLLSYNFQLQASGLPSGYQFGAFTADASVSVGGMLNVSSMLLNNGALTTGTVSDCFVEIFSDANAATPALISMPLVIINGVMNFPLPIMALPSSPMYLAPGSYYVRARYGTTAYTIIQPFSVTAANNNNAQLNPSISMSPMPTAVLGDGQQTTFSWQINGDTSYLLLGVFPNDGSPLPNRVNPETDLNLFVAAGLGSGSGSDILDGYFAGDFVRLALYSAKESATYDYVPNSVVTITVTAANNNPVPPVSATFSGIPEIGGQGINSGTRIVTWSGSNLSGYYVGLLSANATPGIDNPTWVVAADALTGSFPVVAEADYKLALYSDSSGSAYVGQVSLPFAWRVFRNGIILNSQVMVTSGSEPGNHNVTWSGSNLSGYWVGLIPASGTPGVDNPYAGILFPANSGGGDATWPSGQWKFVLYEDSSGYWYVGQVTNAFSIS